MNPNKVKFYYNCMAILLLAVPVLIWLIRSTGMEIFYRYGYQTKEYQQVQMFLYAVMALGVLYFVLKYARFHNMTLNINRRQDFPEVFGIIDRLCRKLKIDVPEVCFLESSIPNAFICKHQNKQVVVLTIPLIEILDNKELETVLAHELTHIRNKDLKLRKYGLLVRCAFLTIPPVHFIEPFISRSREYLADETAACITNAPKVLASALLKIEEYSSSYEANSYKEQRLLTSVPQGVFFFFEGRSCAPCALSRFPSTEKRIERLISLSSHMTDAPSL